MRMFDMLGPHLGEDSKPSTVMFRSNVCTYVNRKAGLAVVRKRTTALEAMGISCPSRSLGLGAFNASLLQSPHIAVALQ